MTLVAAVTRVVEAVIDDRGLRNATLMFDRRLTVTATRREYKKHPRGGRHRSILHEHDIVLTIGRPNYRLTSKVRACVKAGEPFPVKKLVLVRRAPKPVRRVARPAKRRPRRVGEGID